MKILITGGSGYWGSSLIPLLSAQGHDVSVLDMNPPSVEVKEFFRGAVTDSEVLRDAVLGADAVVHMAAIAGVATCEENPELSRKVNVDGTRTVVEEMPEDAFLLFISSSAVYGRMEGKITEESPPNPLNTYGRHKFDAEKIVKNSGISHAIVRPSNLYGVSAMVPPKYAIHRMVNDAVKEGVIHISDGNLMRNFIHVTDASRALSTIIEKKKGCLCNLGDIDVRLYDVATEISTQMREKYGKNVEVEVDGRSEPENLNYSWELLKQMGFSPEKSLRDGISELIDALFH